MDKYTGSLWDENFLPYKEPLTGIQKLDIKALCVCCVNRLPTLQKHFLMQTNNVLVTVNDKHIVYILLFTLFTYYYC